MSPPVVLDAGPLVAILNRNDQFHVWATAQLSGIHEEIITCEAVIVEACFLLRHVSGAASQLMSLLEERVVTLEFELRRHLPHVSELMRKYADTPMSLADACLVRMTELHARTRVFTLDSDFKLYRRHGRQTIPLIYPAQ